MKKLLLIPAMLLLTACPLQLKESLDNGSAAVPEWLPGTWMQVTTSDSPEHDRLNAVADSTGILRCSQLDSLGHVTNAPPRRLVLSTIGDQIYLSVCEQASDLDEGGCYIFRVQHDGEAHVYLRAVKAYGPPHDVGSLRTWLLRRASNDSIFDAAESMEFMKEQ